MAKIFYRYSDKVLFEDQNKTLLKLVEENRAYLRGANLSEAYLREAYLREANLRGADLRGADLRGADLRGAYLRGANLSEANLRWANLSEANLRGAYLRGANLRGARIPSGNKYRRITKKQACSLTKRLWNWMKINKSFNKKDWLEWDNYYKLWPELQGIECFLCIYYNSCEECLLNPTCASSGSGWSKFLDRSQESYDMIIEECK